jgi:hypothetical protein
MQELNPSVAIFLIITLTPLAIYLWCNTGSIQPEYKHKNDIEGKSTDKMTNVNYGAYIKSQGRYYN